MHNSASPHRERMCLLGFQTATRQRSDIFIAVTLTLLMAFPCPRAIAQSDSDWFVSLHSGALFAQPGHSVFTTATLLQGVRYHRFAIGVGVGYDTYDYWKTMPVMAGIGYDFFSKGMHRLALQLNGGYAMAWDTYPREVSSINENDGGNFVHPAINYRLHLDKFTLYFSGGYKFQRLRYDVTPVWWLWGWPAGKAFEVRDFERVTVQVGIGVR